MFKRIAFFGVAVLLAFLSILLFHVAAAKHMQPKGEAQEPLQIDATKAAESLAQAIAIPTISLPAAQKDSHFVAFNNFLKTRYPRVFAQLGVQTFGAHSLLLTWPGADAHAKPVLFIGHQDVVPVEAASRGKWEQPPFENTIVNNTIWGRGAIDDKSTIIGLLEATSALLAQGFVPDRTMYFAFGEDEEVGGRLGAQQIAEYFREKNTTFYAICDEGGMIANNIVPGIADVPVALIGIAEKGSLTVNLSCENEGGHSSMPPEANALEILSGAVHRLQENPFPYKISEPLKGFIEYLGPEMPFVQKLAFTNSGLLKPLIFNAYAQSNSGRAMIHTTLTTTVFNSGVKENVVPSRAQATVNMRILPGETVESCLAHLRKVINDERIEILPMEGANNPTGVSNYKSEAFKELGLAVKDVYPDALVSPFLLIAATDSRHFKGLSDNVYKFMPVEFKADELSMFHGINERITVDNFARCTQVYGQAIKRWGTVE